LKHRRRDIPRLMLGNVWCLHPTPEGERSAQAHTRRTNRREIPLQAPA